MKLYSAAPKASIKMVDDVGLRQALIDVHKRTPITHILETGTNIGLGSTKFIAETLGRLSPAPKQFVTIEASHHSWRQAKENLKRFPFVDPIWGLSTAREDALRFIKDDPALRNHAMYPDIFIDDVRDPVAFYSSEIAGRLGGSRNPLDRIREVADRSRFFKGEDLLAKWLREFQSFTPLLVLDSAGGVGYLEFETVLKIMEKYPYLLLLDDICHLKHFRSYDHVHADPRFAVIGENRDAGWLLARYQPDAC